MSVQLLDKTRKINQLLQNSDANKVIFSDICAELAKIFGGHTLVISSKGKGSRGVRKEGGYQQTAPGTGRQFCGFAPERTSSFYPLD